MRRIVIHGHFYQPPREEPWLDLVPREPSASPDHDWNQRITRQCYASLARARVLDDRGRLARVVNAWSSCSFNVGPTLFRWFDRHAPAVSAAIMAADRASQIRLGTGNAMAMPYHHVILPLASYRDKVTEVRWGMRDFRERYGRDPEGMWLPETAMDEETLAVLADEGIRFTVLAPHQVASPPPFGRPGRWRGGNGRELAVFCYDGALSHDIAFGDLLRDAGTWLDRMLAGPAPDDGDGIVAIATDGETFGHHHEFGDLALAALVDRVERHDAAVLTNFGAILADTPPAVDVAMVTPTSWSCAHGIERWRADCGCRFDSRTSQAWRAPLREGLERLAADVHAVSARDWPAEAGDLAAARDAAGPALLGADELPRPAARILEAERHALAMFTSCGWFFDDIGRIEPRIVLRHAARALDFLPPDDRGPAEARLLATLATTRSFDYEKGTGDEIWHRDVLAEADGPARLAAGMIALRLLIPSATAPVEIAWYTAHFDGGAVVTRHRLTGREIRWHGVAEIAGLVASAVTVTPEEESAAHRIGLDRYPAPIRAILRATATPLVVDATLSPDERADLAAGLVDTAHLRTLALDGAWAAVERDGLDTADILVHAAIDLFGLDDEPLPDALRIEAFERLVGTTPSPERDTLAERLHLALPEAP